FFFTSHAPPPATPHPLSLHDALPILRGVGDKLAAHLLQPMEAGDVAGEQQAFAVAVGHHPQAHAPVRVRRRRNLDRIAEIAAGKDRKSTRLNSSHVKISYAVFCLKKK